MLSSFVQQLTSDLWLTEEETAVLAAVDVRTYEDLHSLVTEFPSIHKFGVRVSELSFAARRNYSPDYVAAAAELERREEPPRIAGSHGAVYPQGAPWQPGSSVPLPSGPPGVASGAPPSGPTPPPPAPPWPNIDLRCAGWPVRHQGQRSTCVSFAVAASVERRAVPNPPAGPDDMSEQFMHWAVKNRDAYPNVEGSTLYFGQEALRHDGVCQEALWLYDPNKVVGPFGPGRGKQPSAWMQSCALQNCHTQVQLYRQFKPMESGAAQLVLDHLKAGRVVAVTVPVFRDPTVPGGPDNWNTNAARIYGRIPNPPPGSTECGGHAICIVGCVPDSVEPTGGYFFFRNSWGNSWASMAPAGTLSPETGYGVLTGSYIENFPWEILVL